MKLPIAITTAMLLCGVAPALADIPVDDAAQLTQRSQTASHDREARAGDDAKTRRQ